MSPLRIMVLGKDMNDKMNSDMRIAIVGDFEAERPSHKETNEALWHGAENLCLRVNADWVPPQALETEAGRTKLEAYDGVFCAPGGPYRSMNGALEAIRFARERGWPFLGT
jgi:CTP synthase (UTP-ammonia lyase)